MSEISLITRRGNHSTDLRDGPPDVFVDASSTSWSTLSWKDVRRPFRVESWSERKITWEKEAGRPLPVRQGWIEFNRAFHALFLTDLDAAQAGKRRALRQALWKLQLPAARKAFMDCVRLAVWDRVHRVEDAIWDPRGKRALFEGLELKRPRILFLGAADGYEAMQLLASYPGGHAVLVDYDPFCRDVRFGEFPSRYPFLGNDPATGQRRVWHRDEMSIDYEVADIRDLPQRAEFDLVLSVGLLEHFPDEKKPEALEWHRRFVKPGGYVVLTTPRDQLRSRIFYSLFADTLNFGYRELMTVEQLGLYAYEGGFEILRAGVIKAHNAVICRAR